MYVAPRRPHRKVYAHRLAKALTDEVDIDSLAPLLHSCDTPACCNPAHLREGTTAENNADMKRKGRHEHGETHHNAKLKEWQVVEILLRLKAGEATNAIAGRYGVTPGAIHEIKKGKNWAHLDRP